MKSRLVARVITVCALAHGAACREYTPRRPLAVIAIVHASGGDAPRCEPSPRRDAPAGRTPAPEVSGALSLLDLVGDDRLQVSEGFFTTWSEDSSEVYYSLARGVARWSVADRTLIAFYPFAERFEQPGWAAVSRDRRWIAASGLRRAAGEARERWATWLIDTTGRVAARLVEEFGAAPLAFLQDGRTVIANGRRLDAERGTIREPPRAVGEFIVFADGTRRLSLEPASAARGAQPSATRQMVRLEDLETGAVLRRFGPVAIRESIAVSGDGSTIAILADDTLEVWDARTLERRVAIHDLRRAMMITLSYDGARALTETLSCASFTKAKVPNNSGCPAPDMTLWDLARSQPVWRQAGDAGRRWVFSRDGSFLTGDDSRYVESVLRAADGRTATFGQRIRSISPDGRWVLHDDGPRVALAASDGASSGADWSRTVALSPDGARRVTYSTSNQLRLEDALSCRVLDGGRAALEGLSFSSDGARLFTVEQRQQRTVERVLRAIRAADGAVEWSVSLTGDGAASARIVADSGGVLAQSTDHDDVLRFDAASGRRLSDGRAPRLRYHQPLGDGYTNEIRDRGGDRVSHLALAQLARDGRTVLSVSDHDDRAWVSLWDLSDPDAVRDLRAPSRPRMIAQSRDDAHWAVGGMDHRVRWVVRQGFQWREAREAHRAELVALATTEDGSRTASAAKDGSVFVYDTLTGAVTGRARFALVHAAHLAFAREAGRDVLVAETANGLRARFSLR